MAKRSTGQAQRRTKPKNSPGIEVDEHGREVLNVSALLPKTKILKLDVVQAHPDDPNDVVIHREVPFQIPGSMPMETMLRLIEFDRILTAPDVTSAQLAPALHDANQLLEGIIRSERGNEDKPFPTRRGYDNRVVAGSFNLNEFQIMGLITFLVGNSSVTQALINLLADDRDGGATAKDALKDTAARAEGDTGEADAAPLGPSKRRSSPRSSSSPSASGGARSGGATARGRRSSATSTT